MQISMASILAKVTRDHIMSDWDREFPGYDFAKHKGYGTTAHYQAIEKI
jgi:ribonuclease HII